MFQLRGKSRLYKFPPKERFTYNRYIQNKVFCALVNHGALFWKGMTNGFIKFFIGTIGTNESKFGWMGKKFGLNFY